MANQTSDKATGQRLVPIEWPDAFVSPVPSQPLPKWAMLTDDCLRVLSDDMVAYLRYEAARRGTDIATVYQEELASEQRARAKALSPAELKVLARESKPDQRRLESDEEYPF